MYRTSLILTLYFSEKDALTAKRVGRGAEDKKITVKITRIEDNLSQVSTRVGLFGNESISRIIHDHIEKNLQSSARIILQI